MKSSLLAALSVMMTVSLTSAKDKNHPVVASPSPVLPSTKAQVFNFQNGLTLIVEEDHSAPVASVQAWCATGSIDEGKWMGAGLSHILEHMLFKGTEKLKGGEIAKRIQERGGYINAYTSFDRTVFWIDVPSDGAGEAVDILADAMMHSQLPEGEYAKEQEVIRREFAMGFDNPDRQSSQLMLRTVFTESPFRHPVIGYLDIYNKLTRADVMAYYKEKYVPNNLTFVVVGDVDAQQIKKQLDEDFNGEPRKALEPVFVATEPDQIGRRDAHEEFPTELSRLSLAWRIPGLTSPDTPALELLGDILGSGRSSILNQAIREKAQLAHQIEAGMFSLQTDGIFAISAICDPDKRTAIEKESLALVEDVKKSGVTQAQLDKARRTMLSNQFSSLSTARGRASDLGSSWLLTRNPNFSKDYLDAIAKVTPADVQRVAQTYLQTDRLNVTSLNPIGSLEPKGEDVASVAKSDVKIFTLKNGLRLLVREDSRLPVVSIYAAFRSGLLAETPETNGITRLLSQTIIKGTKTRSAAQIAEEVESLGGRLGADNGNNSFSVSLEVMKPDFAAGLAIFADILQNPTFPVGEVELEKKTQLASIKEEEEQITAVARNATREKLFGNHLYAMRNVGSAESVEKLTPEKLQAFFKQYAVAKNGVLAVFGDVKADEVLNLVEQDFGQMPSGELALTTPPVPTYPTAPTDTVVERNKQQAVLMFGYPGASILDKDRVALELINEASNDLGSRFFNRIRENMGLCYYVGAGNLAGLAPGSFVFYLGTDPKKVERVKVEFQDEIAKLAKDGLTEEELARAKKKLLGSEAIRNQSNGSFAASSAVNELVGLGYDDYLRRKQQIEAITLDDVKRVANKYLDTPNRVEVVVQPPAKPESSPQPANP